jgi:aspartate-semialdehyde dehydrogenase
LGIKAERCAITCCTQPVFAGMTASLYVRGTFSVEEAEQALRGALGLQTATQLRSLRPRKVMGRAPVYWSSVRADPGGDGVHLWLAADNLTGAGAAVPVALAEAVLAGGLLSRAEA